MGKFYSYRQYDSRDCGATCLRMIARYYGKKLSQQYFRDNLSMTSAGTSLLSISKYADSIGLHNVTIPASFEEFCTDVSFPCIVHWKKSHFVVVYKINKGKIFVADPAFGKIAYTKEEFVHNWICLKDEGVDKGIVMMLEPTEAFNDIHDNSGRKNNIYSFLLSYFTKYRKTIGHLLLGLLIGCIIQFTLPFLTQSIVDIGIQKPDINFLYLVLIGQFVLLVSRTSIEFVRRWILLNISARVNLSLVSDFFVKLMNLPMSFFDTKQMGDLMQRIEDHDRIQRFLTSQTLNVIFVSFNIIVFSIVLLIYSFKIFAIFIIGSLIYSIWVLSFLRRRKVVDYKLFEHRVINKNKILQLLSGMQEIKLQGCKKRKRWEWEDAQVDLFKVNLSSLSLQQTQEAGSIFINESRNIIIILITSLSVINGELTLGMMLAIQYIIGLLNTPIIQVMDFIHDLQDVRISIERVNEIHQKKEENADRTQKNIINQDGSIHIENVSFQYGESASSIALKNISLEIPRGKITAIVGTSGSGKTTLIKLLLGFFKPTKGEIFIGKENLVNIDLDWWRGQCGTVMQDNYIFSDTIARNIAIADGDIDAEKLLIASNTSNIGEFIQRLPLKFDTIIGQDGQNLSQGQKQRILISRVVYKDSPYIYLDEATNSLDANNEKEIEKNLSSFYIGKTVVIVAHRLSTVKNADQIVVLEKGEIIEIGNHEELISKKGAYFHLVKNQLELGN